MLHSESSEQYQNISFKTVIKIVIKKGSKMLLKHRKPEIDISHSEKETLALQTLDIDNELCL